MRLAALPMVPPILVYFPTQVAVMRAFITRQPHQLIQLRLNIVCLLEQGLLDATLC